MKKLLNLRTAFIVVAVSFATFSGIKGYQYVTNMSSFPTFLLENAEALAQGEGTGTLKLDCEKSEPSTKCMYRCESCGNLYESSLDDYKLSIATGVCRCGHPGH